MLNYKYKDMARKPNYFGLSLTYGRVHCNLTTDEKTMEHILSFLRDCDTQQPVLHQFVYTTNILYNTDVQTNDADNPKSKPLVKIGFLGGRYIILHAPQRVSCRIYYDSIDELILDLPLTVFDYKIINLTDNRLNSVDELW